MQNRRGQSIHIKKKKDQTLEISVALFYFLLHGKNILCKISGVKETTAI